MNTLATADFQEFSYHCDMRMHSSTNSVFRKAVFVTGFAALVAGAGVCLDATGMISAPSANAGSGHETTFAPATANTTPPAMNLSGSSDEKMNTEQGNSKPATDGTVNSGPQCTSLSAVVACETQAEEATPQYLTH